MTLAGRVAERLRQDGYTMHRATLDDALLSFAEIVELGDIAIPTSDDIEQYQSALRRLADALGIEDSNERGTR